MRSHWLYTRSKGRRLLLTTLTGFWIGCCILPETSASADPNVVSKSARLSIYPAFHSYRSLLFENGGTAVEEVRGERPPSRTGRQLFQAVGGFGTGVLGATAGGLVGFGIGWIIDPGIDGSFFWGSSETPSALTGTVIGVLIGYPVGTALGVFAIGDTETETGDFGATLLGGVLGGALGAVAGGWPSIPGVPVGATIGFTLTRKYKPPTGPQGGELIPGCSRARIGLSSVGQPLNPQDRPAPMYDLRLFTVTF